MTEKTYLSMPGDQITVSPRSRPSHDVRRHPLGPDGERGRRPSGRHLGVDESGTDHVDRDARAAYGLTESEGEAIEPAFAAP